MTDRDTLELQRMIAHEPAHRTEPDLTGLFAAGRRARSRRRAVSGGVALGTAAAVAVPMLLLAGGGTTAPPSRESSPAATTSAATPSTAPREPEPPCGVLSCVHHASSSVETGTVIGELAVGTLPGGASEVIYVARNPGAGEWEGQVVDVLSSGYRLDGQLRRTAWALQPGSDGAGAPRFWTTPELANGRPGENDHYTVLGYVDGSPDEITWSTPDGRSGAVDGVLRLDGYTAFYVTHPMPAGYVPPPRATQNPDGSITIETDEGPRTFHSGDPIPGRVILGGGTEFSPDLTIHTSDGWSCTFEECGTTG